MHATTATLFALTAVSAVMAAPLGDAQVDGNVGPVQFSGNGSVGPSGAGGQLDAVGPVSVSGDVDADPSGVNGNLNVDLSPRESTIKTCTFVNGQQECYQSNDGGPPEPFTPQKRELPNVNTDDLPADSPLRHLGPGPVVSQKRQLTVPADSSVPHFPNGHVILPKREPTFATSQPANSPIRFLGPGPVIPSGAQKRQLQIDVDSLPEDSPLRHLGHGPVVTNAKRVNRPFTPIAYGGPILPKSKRVNRPFTPIAYGGPILPKSKRQEPPAGASTRPDDSDPRLLRIVPGSDFNGPNVYSDDDTAASAKREELIALLVRAIDDLE